MENDPITKLKNSIPTKYTKIVSVFDEIRRDISDNCKKLNPLHDTSRDIAKLYDVILNLISIIEKTQ